MAAQVNLPYLWAASGRNRVYWYYRRAGQRLPICDEAGKRFRPGELGFLDAYSRIHESFEDSGRDGAAPGSLSQVIAAYRAAPEFQQLKPRTRGDYSRYLDHLGTTYGHLPVATMPREFVRALRDEHRATPRTANYMVQVLRLVLTFAEDQPRRFVLPTNWRNPAREPKLLRTGDGYRPWEELEIDVFRKRWALGTLERTLFETFLGTGQRGGDIAAMRRQQYYRGEIAVVQAKTRERVWIPVSQDLRKALDIWLEDHEHIVLFPTATGRPLKPDHMRHVMRAAIRHAGLSDDCKLHGLRYTFATRGIEVGLDWQTIAAIVGHRTAAMVQKYTAKRRLARLSVVTVDQGARERKATCAKQQVKTPPDRSENHEDDDG